MTYLDFQDIIEKQFDYICKRVISDEKKDYYRYLSKISKKELFFSELGNSVDNLLLTSDTYPSDLTFFKIYDTNISIQDDSLANAIIKLPEKNQAIILLYYFMGFNDLKIAKLLKLSRSTVNEHRNNSLKFLKKNWGLG